MLGAAQWALSLATRHGSYAGTLFLDVEPNDAYSIEAPDLYALTTLLRHLTSKSRSRLATWARPRAG